MSERPPRDIDWIPDDATGINVPSQTKQNEGWIIEKPARQFFNFLANRQSRWSHYLSGQSQEFIVIDSTNANEKDYDTLAAYIADSPTAGDKVLVKETQVLAAQMIIPDGITLRLLNGVNFTRSTLEGNSVIKFESNVIIEGILNLILSHTGTTAKAVEFDGDNVVGQIDVENASTGILTTAHSINSGKTGNQVEGIAKNSGGGILTNVGIDNSTEDSNVFRIVDESSNQIWRSRGAYKFRDGFEFDLGSDADGDIYYRDAGILKRLPKGSDVDVLTLSSGLPVWSTPIFSESFTSAEQAITAAGSLVLAHGLSNIPYLIMPYIICKTAELGYSIGDELLINPAGNDPSGTSNRGLSVVPDTVNLNIRIGSTGTSISIINKSTGAATAILNANWKLIVRAWA